MKLKATQTSVSVGFLNRLQDNDHFWKWVLKFGTSHSARDFITKVEHSLNKQIIDSNRSDVKLRKTREKSEILLFLNRNRDNLEKYFKDYNNVKYN